LHTSPGGRMARTWDAMKEVDTRQCGPFERAGALHVRWTGFAAEAGAFFYATAACIEKNREVKLGIASRLEKVAARGS